MWEGGAAWRGREMLGGRVAGRSCLVSVGGELRGRSGEVAFSPTQIWVRLQARFVLGL